MLISILFVNSTPLQAQLGKCKGKYLGNVIQSSTTSGAGINYNTYWNQATSENNSKWGSVESSQGVYNFSGSDVAYNWAKNNSGIFKYHNFVWGSQTPGYVASASTATLTTAIENYIKAVANHYNPLGGLKFIDVVNEPIKTALPGNYKAALTAGYKRDNPSGTDQYGWIIWAFQLARKYHPNAKLLINEYSIENDPNGALVTYAAMVNAVKNAPNLTDGQKNLIDGIGLQCHAFSINTLSGTNFKAALDKLYSLTSLPMHITEFDLDANPNETTQKNKYQELFPVAWEHAHVAGITLWGYVQGDTWRNGNGTAGANGTDSGIMYAAGGERPALTWLKQYMATQPDLSGCPLPGTVGPGWGTTTTTNTAPTVSISSPVNNASFTAPASITISATAADADGTVSNVQFYNGTTLLGSDATSPYSFSWTGVTSGTYTITAKATDNSGAVTTSTAIAIAVIAAANTAPTVSISSPANNASFATPASITITATAADADGTVSNVQFYNGTTLLGSDATSPYSFSWTGVVAGTYSITAKATDNAGAVTTSTAVSITVTTTTTTPSTGFVTISNKTFMVNGCPIYFNGANTPWQNWNDFGGNYSSSFWASEFARLKNSGINSSRVWISCDGDVQPSINTDGTVTGVSTQFFANLDDFFTSAKNNGIYIMATMMSFDHVKNNNYPNAASASDKYNSWRNMMNNQTKVQTYIDNYLVPFVNRYKTNPYLMSIDLCNEIEWMAENAEDGNLSYAVLQRYVAMSASAIHKNSNVLVTVGSASVKWNSPNYSTGNKWSDAALQAQFNDATAKLDYYCPHYYGWMYSSFKSPFDMTVAQYGMTDKPVVIGEMVSVANLPTPSMPILTAFNNMKSGGYQGHFPWTSNLASTSNEIGTLTDFGPSSLSFKNANANLVAGTCANANLLPTISLTAPVNNATFTAPASVTVTATAADADGTVSNVQFYNGTTLLSSDATAPYSFVWTNVTAGTYVITAKATDNSGGVTTSTAVSIIVSAPINKLPVISLTAPASGAVFTAPVSITLTAAASDSDGTVSNVQFYNGTTLLGADATAPYSFVWANVAAGTYTITAKATDNSGAVITSGAVSITVNPAPNVAPTVSITTPLNNATFTAPASVTITAAAADADGTVSSVQFYNGTTLLGSDATSPYSFAWTNVAAGTYSITAVATDNSGATTTSTAVSITVNPAPANVAPTVSITAPLDGSMFTAPASVSITANAADADGIISNVQFYNGPTLLSTDATSPYSFAWTNVAAGIYSITAVATDNSGATTTSTAVSITVNPAPANVAPTVSITAPLDGSTFTAPASVSITANAADADGTVSSVQFYNGTTLLGSDATSPYSFAWTNVAAGIYSITVVATDNSGATTTSTAVSITVNLAPANVAPTVSITAPLDGSTFTAPASISITANAADVDGTISNVQFYNGTTLLGTDASSPYSYTWNGVAAGTYSITAKATDNSGAVTTSSLVSITVTPPPNQAPVVSITAPANNATFTAPASVTIAASASDIDGTISSVQFYNGTTLLGSDATSPYSFAWNGVAVGTYVITAKATDNSGAVTTSAAISITVTAAPVGDLIGPDCGAANATISFELNPARRTSATSYAWWFQGYTQSITPVAGSTYKVNIQTGQYFTGGQVCVGVSYSVAPYSATYCKAITKCASGARLDDLAMTEEMAAVNISPNPSSSSFTITAGQDIQTITVIDSRGIIAFTTGGLTAGQSLYFGDQLSNGLYIVNIQYSSGKVESKKVQKVM